MSAADDRRAASGSMLRRRSSQWDAGECCSAIECALLSDARLPTRTPRDPRKMINEPEAGLAHTRTSAVHPPSPWHAKLAPVAIAAVIIATLCLLRRPFPVGIAQDDGLYVILAKALATGQGFHFINLPGAPAGVHFPPGYPLFLAGLWRVTSSFPANVLAFAVANMVLLGVAGGAAYRTRSSPWPCACRSGRVRPRWLPHAAGAVDEHGAHFRTLVARARDPVAALG